MAWFRLVKIFRIYSFTKKNMQNYAKLGDIDPYSLHNKCIISVIILLYSMKFIQKTPPQKKKESRDPMELST